MYILLIPDSSYIHKTQFFVCFSYLYKSLKEFLPVIPEAQVNKQVGHGSNLSWSGGRCTSSATSTPLQQFSCVQHSPNKHFTSTCWPDWVMKDFSSGSSLAHWTVILGRRTHTLLYCISIKGCVTATTNVEYFHFLHFHEVCIFHCSRVLMLQFVIERNFFHLTCKVRLELIFV